MDLKDMAYDMCRHYVLDQQGLIDDVILQRTLGWIRSRNIAKLSSIDAEVVGAYRSLPLCRFTRQVAAFFKKNTVFSDDDICNLAAEHSFFEAEQSCKETNIRLDSWDFNNPGVDIDPELAHDIHTLQNIITNVLGDIGPFHNNILNYVKVTSGATATRKRRVSRPFEKMNLRNIPTTRRARKYATWLLKSLGFKKFKFNIQEHNRVEVVLKNWKTHRTIACENEINTTFQLAFDGYVKDRLIPFGIDLSDQSKNFEMARQASISDSNATVDMKQASDTIAYNVVCLLLPFEWFQYLDTFRSPLGHGFGRTFSYEKFSSMGNGSTFTIESLIFGSICKLVSEGKEWATYGDDLIVPKESLPRLTKIMEFLGFKINHDKTFAQGFFRESCGGDFYDGVNVTPFYVRNKLRNVPELVHQVNGLAAIALPEGRLWKYLMELTVKEKLPLAPYSDDSVAGVHVSVRYAYEKKMIKTTHWIPKYKAITAHAPTEPILDWRTYFLWHLDAVRRHAPYQDNSHPFNAYSNKQRRQYEPVSIIRSQVQRLSFKYKRKWVCWIPPAGVTPSHIYMWTDYLARSMPA